MLNIWPPSFPLVIQILSVILSWFASSSGFAPSAFVKVILEPFQIVLELESQVNLYSAVSAFFHPDGILSSCSWLTIIQVKLSHYVASKSVKPVKDDRSIWVTESLSLKFNYFRLMIDSIPVKSFICQSSEVLKVYWISSSVSSNRTSFFT